MAPNDNPNRQRDHQANERTFLAWLRTSVALIAFGFAIARFGLFARQLESAISGQIQTVPPLFNSENLGVALVIIGILLMSVSAWRYNQVYWQIEHNDFRPSRMVIWVMTVIVTALGVLSIPILVRRVPETPNKLLPPAQHRSPDL